MFVNKPICPSKTVEFCNTRIPAQTDFAKKAEIRNKKGFGSESVFQNLHYVLETSKRTEIPEEIRKSFYWVLWMLWKNRNSFIFEGMTFLAIHTMEKIREDVLQWFHVQVTVSGDVVDERRLPVPPKPTWYSPPSGWSKCNVGFSWNHRRTECGVAWVLRNHFGQVLLHGRRSFTNVSSSLDSSELSLKWAIECMTNLIVHKVVFALEAKELVRAITRPPAWPSFKFQPSMFVDLLDKIPRWRILLDAKSANRGAFLIAASVTKENHWRLHCLRTFTLAL